MSDWARNLDTYNDDADENPEDAERYDHDYDYDRDEPTDEDRDELPF